MIRILRTAFPTRRRTIDVQNLDQLSIPMNQESKMRENHFQFKILVVVKVDFCVFTFLRNSFEKYDFTNVIVIICRNSYAVNVSHAM